MKHILMAAIALLSAFVTAQAGDTIRYDNPRLEVYPLAGPQASLRAVLLCPGGGYGRVVESHEGSDWVNFYHNLGFSVAVLDYDLPRGNARIPIDDVENAMILLKKEAPKYGWNPDSIGVMGFSAGGHLAAMAATTRRPEARPAFQVLFYPVITMDPSFTNIITHNNLLGKKGVTPEQEAEYSCEKRVEATTPQAFITFCYDDDIVPVTNGTAYFNALYAAKVPAVLHVYKRGGHGWGYKPGWPFRAQMLDDLTAWLRSL